ncbi:MAG: hypothetical protein U0794_02845 [Isosphaeraceae bacterium]
MNVLILGDGAEERRWALDLVRRPEFELRAAFPGFPDLPHGIRPRDLDEALALADIDLVVVGGDMEFRGEALRRAAAEGMLAICLHPPGPDSEAYYQVALSRAETGAIVVPDLPFRLHPGVERLRSVLDDPGFGAFRGLRLEATVVGREHHLARWWFARFVDLIRALLGEIEAVTATGDPPGVDPDLALVVQMRAANGRRAEIRLTSATQEVQTLILEGTNANVRLEFPGGLDEVARWTERASDGTSVTQEIPAWDSRGVILRHAAAARRGEVIHPDLGDATRAMEVSEGAVRSLRRGRTVDLYYEEISESGTFKSVMTSAGCLILLSILVILPIALGAAAMGLRGAIYLAYAIPPLLLIFLLLQLLRFAAHDSGSRESNPGQTPPSGG